MQTLFVMLAVLALTAAATAAVLALPRPPAR